jgi:hypothetical protein
MTYANGRQQLRFRIPYQQTGRQREKVVIDQRSIMRSKVLVTHADTYSKWTETRKVDPLKYIGTTLTKDGQSTTDIKTRLAITTLTMAKLSKIYTNQDISFPTKIYICIDPL